MRKNNKTALRVLSTATFLAMVASCTAPAFAATYDISAGNISVSARDDGQYVSQWTEDADKNRTYTTKENREEDETIITGASSSNSVTIDAEKGQTANVTLDNVNIDASDTNKAAVSTEGVVSIELDGNNTLQGGDGHAALEKWSNAVDESTADTRYKLTITDKDNNGSLTATGGAGGAGIGGTVTDGGYANNITITGGTIAATGGDGGAGIGGGKGDSTKLIGNFGGGNASSIIISGSNTTVIAKGTGGGAGIGGGLGDDANLTGQGLDITIKDGAHVSATGSAGGAGIGGGDRNADKNKQGTWGKPRAKYHHYWCWHDCDRHRRCKRCRHRWRPEWSGQPYLYHGRC